MPNMSSARLKFAAAAVYGGATGLAFWWLRDSSQKDSHDNANGATPFDRQAKTYDSLVDKDEKTTGMYQLRQTMVNDANGRVLEIAAGTGRNLGFYDANKCKSVTLLEASQPMADVLRSKLAQLRAPPSPTVSTVFNVMLGDATKLPFDAGEFDTVVDTFGLCSISDPVEALRELGRVVRPGGQVLLLEHGRGTVYLINLLLDVSNGKHKRDWGCEHNRDIEAIVQQAGLKILSHERLHFGTTHVIRATTA